MRGTEAANRTVSLVEVTESMILSGNDDIYVPVSAPATDDEFSVPFFRHQLQPHRPTVRCQRSIVRRLFYDPQHVLRQRLQLHHRRRIQRSHEWKDIVLTGQRRKRSVEFNFQCAASRFTSSSALLEIKWVERAVHHGGKNLQYVISVPVMRP